MVVGLYVRPGRAVALVVLPPPRLRPHPRPRVLSLLPAAEHALQALRLSPESHPCGVEANVQRLFNVAGVWRTAVLGPRDDMASLTACKIPLLNQAQRSASTRQERLRR